MQRGRGRRRGDPSRARSTSTRGSRSSSRRSTFRTDRRPTLRRSARLAELLNGDFQSIVADSSMANLVRPRALENRTVGRSRHHSGRGPHRSRSGRASSSSPEEIRHEMDVVLQPRPTAQVDEPLPPIVVRLRTVNADLEDAVADSMNLVVVASLVAGSDDTVSMDPETLNSILSGTRFKSIRPFSDDEADGLPFSIELDGPRGVGYLYFDTLTIRHPGTYRIRFTLLRIRRSSSDPPVSSVEGALSIGVVDSTSIVVQGNGSYNGDDDNDDGGWLEVLRAIQERRRSEG
ncbi:hypothetical protein CC78DRAFT_203506 [Lojkania enalia]|uniref:Velvet domain-containing protein n=1 Tax=Lojkania enalia TaxID=147567 RepID=A0A9P4N4W7_9PLEO|nr:hypothetical protein CC78DRAFT_203506 [Didymosphaeria enalia]